MGRMPKEVDYASREEYYESLDKRTKEFKDYYKWKANFEKQNSIGAGDVIEKVTTVTGIKLAVKFIAGEDCGCNERKERLNKTRFRIRECPNEQEFKFMESFLNENKRTVTKSEQQNIVNILNKTLGKKYKANSCGSCLTGKISELRKLYEAYL